MTGPISGPGGMRSRGCIATAPVQLNGLAELITIARYHELWSNQTCVICVLHNNDLNQVTW